MAKNHAIVLFLDRNGFSIFQDTLAGILRFNFPLETVSNLDVFNREQLSSSVNFFITTNKITPSSLIIVLSDDVVYKKDLSLDAKVPASTGEADEIQKFLENVPFEDVLAKVIRTESMVMLVGTNKNLIVSIADIFLKIGSVLEAVAPGFLYGPVLNFATGLTSSNAAGVLQGGELLRLGNLLTDQENMILPQSSNSGEKDSSTGSGQNKPQNVRQYILIGVFVTLLIILGLVYLSL